MKKQAFNPVLPENEYIPDGEPHIFNNRVYVYGSHDKFNAPMFCMNDYVCWSAPVSDLSDWNYEGVIYKKSQDPTNHLGLQLLFAPDIVQGEDGNFYLFYSLGFTGTMAVAVCNSPCGHFQFYKNVCHPNGKRLGRKKGDPFMFDPGILRDDDGKIYVYSGFATEISFFITGGHKLKFEGGYVMEMEKDMCTVKTEPKLLFPKTGKGSFTNHEFFEASSIRKYNNIYYFVYSSRHNHELCYAYSQYPNKDFTYGGILISNGDINVDIEKNEAKASNYTGNTHGGMLKIENDYYIFYHRQTNRHSYSRQLCAEKLQMNEKGIFLQSEMTSCGLNGKPLKGTGTYKARTACNLWSKEGAGRYDSFFSKIKYLKHPYFTQTKNDKNPAAQQYIANMHNGATAGFKYFKMDSANTIKIEYKGKAYGTILVSSEKSFSYIAAEIPIKETISGITNSSAVFSIESGKQALYFRFQGKGKIDFFSFTLYTQ